ncbi:nuclease [Saccharibacter sp. 17.LH.SD]|uniref:helix-turn-helix transcriptional regulator n=1 Tax=Saccharibacter sp. 17.LH.SD TaxID=2689393 RepID=UPI00136C267A|nr:helix-turn-helix transcriptional regulator [Saccharibacter sp. 17.LH.SD]MXV44300.1 nuclease [Saccharibacter sp. 17.LH.SD]
MTPERFRECLLLMHWSQRGFARIVDRAEATVRQWARGKVTIPSDVAEWLEKGASFIESNPPPVRLPKP